jgi:hypothetical protein
MGETNIGMKLAGGAVLMLFGMFAVLPALVFGANDLAAGAAAALAVSIVSIVVGGTFILRAFAPMDAAS